jgi:hypothetical protein
MARLPLRRKRSRRERLQRRAEDLVGRVWLRGARWYWRELKGALSPRAWWAARH